ncbi:class I SAM-dependent methyltransferase [Geobacter sp. DSM 9736]|uniref:class I SAM-dependent methyltransferase n=1 Tax=Geobacter sp. DSM 9736 TaxID=1277350 RepID=UPI000B4FF329|nr:class I SAM-dependent methyltransferase [Geobacter sp. DSM 9736]SNB46518.1 Putative rRNA methylase [Geobacter sp. DSM 9736]
MTPEKRHLNAVGLSHMLLRDRVGPGGRVVDGTCGNGHDTLFLASLVGETGHVWSFDVQDEALRRARARLAEAGSTAQVEFVDSGHERLAEFVAGPLQAAIFNLGYLPGGDKSRITRPETTIPALSQAVELLAPGGILVAVLYPGHPGGAEECAAVEAWGESLPSEDFSVWKSSRVNVSEKAAYVLSVEKVAAYSRGGSK